MGQLTKSERYQIYTLLKIGKTTPEIACFLKRHRSSIWRELKRNSGKRGYRPKQANETYVKRRESCQRVKLIQGELKKTIDERLDFQHSPEQISGYLRHEKDILVSHECIYQYLLSEKQMGGTLYKNLRRSHRKRKKRFGSINRQGQIPNRTFIDKRPKIIEERSRIGDWEGDTIIGKNHKGVLVSLVERKSKYLLLGKVKRKTKYLVTQSILKMLKPYNKKVKSLTVDNGKEFSDHEIISKKGSFDIYFANPYSSWERGTNENTNGLIRQYFPKKLDLREVTDEMIKQAEDLINHRPRKCLGFKTPHQILVKGKKIRYLN